MVKQGIILLGHGARNPEWAAPFHRIRAAILGRQPAVAVEFGFLELMRPTFAEGVTSLVSQRVQRIVVIPIFISAGSHVREDLPRLVAAARAHHPGVEIGLAEPVGEAQSMIDAMADYAIGSVFF